MKRRLKWAVVGGASCAAAAIVVTMLMTPEVQPASSPLQVPQAQDSELALPRPTTSVSALPPLEQATSPQSTTSQPPPTTTSEPPPNRQPPPRRETVTLPQGVDFQAEDALIQNGVVKSSPGGFTGRGFVDTENVAGSFVQWTVNASRTGQTDVSFRFANGNNGDRPMDITVNGILVDTLDFPSTGSFSTYRVLTIRVSLLGGGNKIRATSRTGDGGPNLDKITTS